PRAIGDAGGARQDSNSLFGRARLSGGRRADELRNRLDRCVASSRRLYRQYPQGRQARRSACPAGREVRTRHQPGDRDAARHRGAAATPSHRRRGDRMIRRRNFITLLGGAAAWPLAASAQQRPVVGHLISRTQGEAIREVADFRDGLRETGFAEGVTVEYRWANGENARLPDLVALYDEVAPKRLEVMHALLPTAKDFALLVDPTNPNSETQSNDMRAAARTLG